ncbi:MAG: bifunctional oligoribonuclease/PAP phosphatase NrnA [Erysipelotrichaceae bacterium]|nr:bifunctional oligoribonuclease/PAP phosphatase NrnA [Erysipelotrichaceae bacterium]
MEVKEFKQIIERHDSIVIYRHVNPDFDAYGSQLGLKYLIKENYPEKKVYTAGFDALDNPVIDAMDNPSRDICSKSLTISFDTASKDRIDGDFYFDGAETMKIDHHFNSEVFSPNTYADHTACSASLILSRLARANGFRFNKIAASFIFAGILTDTCRLAINTVNSETFETLAFLTECGVDVVKVNSVCFDKSIDEYKAYHYLSNRVVFEKNTAYVIVHKEDIDALNIPANRFNDMVDVMDNINGVDRYSLYTEISDDCYRCSLRSHKQSIREIAVEYGGGGHKLASGASNVTLKQVMEMIQKIRDLD